MHDLSPVPPPRGPSPLRRTWGGWRGTAEIARFEAIPVQLRGGWLRPCRHGVAALVALPDRVPGMLGEAADAVHARLAAWQLDGMPLTPRLAGPGEVWDHVAPAHLRLERRRGCDHAEIGLRVSWDDEHTWGALYSDWRLVALNESVIGLGYA